MNESYYNRIEFELKDCGREDLIELLKKEKNNE
jgi:hypothetical protein